MCVFSRPVEHVSGTRILARALGPVEQVLVYAMTVGASTELAMLLPLPVPAGTGEDAVRFVDLSGYPGFFGDVEEAFRPPPAPGPQSLSRSLGIPGSFTLKV